MEKHLNLDRCYCDSCEIVDQCMVEEVIPVFCVQELVDSFNKEAESNISWGMLWIFKYTHIGFQRKILRFLEWKKKEILVKNQASNIFLNNQKSE
jgi:hypothetical protein